MSTPKEIHLNPDKDGKFLLGSHFHILQDESSKTFETDNMEAFESFLVDKQDGNEIYFSAERLYLVPLKASYYSHAVAHCAMKPSPALALIVNKAGKDMSIPEFEKFLTALRKHTEEGRKVLNHLRNFVSVKETTFERLEDGQGNFRMLVQRKSGNNDWTPPATMTFTIPVFSFLKEEVTIAFDFRYYIADDGTKPMFTLENLNLIEELQDRRREIIETRLGENSKCPKYWGTSQLHQHRDEWRYKENKATL